MSDRDLARGPVETDTPVAEAPEVKSRMEKLFRLLAELYNENTRLRHRLRLLERETVRASERS